MLMFDGCARRIANVRDGASLWCQLNGRVWIVWALELGSGVRLRAMIMCTCKFFRSLKACHVWTDEVKDYSLNWL